MLSAEELCKKVFALDERIFFVGVFNEDRLLHGGPRRGRAGLITDHDKLPMLRMQLHLVKTMLQEWNRFFGDTDVVSLRFRKALLCAFPWRDKWLHVVAEPTLTAATIRKGVQPLLQ